MHANCIKPTWLPVLGSTSNSSVFFPPSPLSTVRASQRPVHAKIDESPAQVYRCQFPAQSIKPTVNLPIMDARDSASESSTRDFV